MGNLKGMYFREDVRLFEGLRRRKYDVMVKIRNILSKPITYLEELTADAVSHD